MTIKIRLALSFFAMIIMVALVGIFFIYSGSVRARYFQNAILSTKVSGIAKEMKYYLDQQLHSFDYYVMLNDDAARIDYKDYKKAIAKCFFEWKNLTGKADESINEINSLEKIYNNVVDSADTIIDLKNAGKTTRALAVVNDYYTPKVSVLRKNISEIMKNKEMFAAMSQNEARKIAEQQMIISLVVIIVSIIIGLLLALYIFQFISKPLYNLQKGAQEIGSGNFDYHLVLANENDEFGKLAQSFNEMSENLRKMQSQIIQLDRMSAMGQLAGGVAHELNNPLTGVLGQAQILMGKLGPDDPSRPQIEKIERAAIRCRKIVRELLDFSRQKEYNFVESNIHELVDATLLLCESDLAAVQVSVIKEFASDIELIALSQPHIQQVFLNLINNALHAMSPGGKLIITTRLYKTGYVMKDRRKNGQDIVVPGKWLEVTFKDTGSGISEQNLQHIFDPFFTTKEVGKGTGLGLTISYGIVQNHKGVILGESDGAGMGSTFRVRLPYERG